MLNVIGLAILIGLAGLLVWSTLDAGMLPGSRPASTDIVTAPPEGPSAHYGEYIPACPASAW